MTAASVFGQAPAEFRGKITGLRPDTTQMAGYLLRPIPPNVRFSFDTAPAKSATITGAMILDPRTAGAKPITFLLIESPATAPYFYYDFNRNGRMENAEKIVTSPKKDSARGVAGTIELPYTHATLNSFPVLFEYDPDDRPNDVPGDARVLRLSFSVNLVGELEIGGRKILVSYQFKEGTAAISVTEGLFGADVNGDGSIDSRPFSPESFYATSSSPVFRVGETFFSTASVDVGTGVIVARSRPASDIVRVLLEVGKEMPDFDFIDFDGKPRKLSDFRGKYLLIDVWGLWCRDCLIETPFLVRAHGRFKSRGFEILGINSDPDDKVADAKKYLTDNEATWPQASFPSVKSLIEATYGIQWYPSMILLGPDGKVLVIDQKALLGERLLETLEKTLPKTVEPTK